MMEILEALATLFVWAVGAITICVIVHATMDIGFGAPVWLRFAVGTVVISPFCGAGFFCFVRLFRGTRL